MRRDVCRDPATNLRDVQSRKIGDVSVSAMPSQ
jgi:hypothetical protein